MFSFLLFKVYNMSSQAEHVEYKLPFQKDYIMGHWLSLNLPSLRLDLSPELYAK